MKQIIHCDVSTKNPRRYSLSDFIILGCCSRLFGP
jgi:hypothetical protein